MSEYQTYSEHDQKQSLLFLTCQAPGATVSIYTKYKETTNIHPLDENMDGILR